MANLDIERVTVVPGATYPIAGVLNAGRGVFGQGEINGASTNYAVLHRLGRGQLVMRKLTAWEGPITVVPDDFDGYFVSSEFPTFTLDRSRIEPGFMGLVCQMPKLWEAMKGTSTGTVQRRKRVSPDALLAIKIDLPPLRDQRRLSDLVSAISEVARRTRVCRARAEDLLTAARAAHAAEVPTVRLGDLTQRLENGASPRCLDRVPSKGEWGVVKTSAVSSGTFRRSEAKTLPGHETPRKRDELADGDLLLTRASGSPERVGVACLVTSPPPRLLLSDLVFRLHVDKDLVASSYLVHALSTPKVRRQLKARAVGSASMKKVNQGIIRSLEVGLAPREDQEKVAESLDCHARIVRKATRAAEALDKLARTVVDRSLAGHVIPDSYDRFLEDASNVAPDLAGRLRQ